MLNHIITAFCSAKRSEIAKDALAAAAVLGGLALCITILTVMFK